MIRILSLVLTILIISAIAVVSAGHYSSPQHEENLNFRVAYSYELVWQELLNIDSAVESKTDVKSIEVLERYGKLIAWKENLKGGGYRTYRMNQRIENKKLVIEMTDSSYGLKGVWTFDITPVGTETEINILEESTLNNIYVRGYRTIFGRNYELLLWQKYIKVGLMETLLTTP